MNINKNDLIDILEEWELNKDENKPLSIESFVDYIIEMYDRDSSKREDIRKNDAVLGST